MDVGYVGIHSGSTFFPPVVVFGGEGSTGQWLQSLPPGLVVTIRSTSLAPIGSIGTEDAGDVAEFDDPSPPPPRLVVIIMYPRDNATAAPITNFPPRPAG